MMPSHWFKRNHAFSRAAFAVELEHELDQGHTYVAPSEGVRKDRDRGEQEADADRQVAAASS